MSSVDNRVVELEMDNRSFEQGAQQSLNTLDRLDKSLRFEGASDGFNTLQKAANAFNLSAMGNAVQEVGHQFSAWEVMAITAISNVTNRAVDAGINLAKSLSIDQVSAGWQKFGSKTQSVATLVAQGYKLEDVNEQLDRLNWYTDETSYNFTDMVSNIAKFTATGQDLKSSVTAMEGIANWAALSGQNASTASRAMYQLSQAMSKGALRYDDFKSIQNASMDTQEFRQKAIEAAIAVGTLKKNADGTYKVLSKVSGETAKTTKKGKKKTESKATQAASSATVNELFASDLLTRQQWLSTDVMMKTFQSYGSAIDQIYEYTEEHGGTASEAIEALGDKVNAFGLKAFKAAQEARTWGDVVDSVKDAVSTGWMNTFELIFGNQEEATKLWTDLANAMWDVFASGSEVRNEILGIWKDDGGRDKLIQAFWELWDAFGEIKGLAKGAWETIFPAKTIEERAAILSLITDKVEKIARSFKALFFKNTFKSPTEQYTTTYKDLQKALTGIFSLIDAGKTVLKDIVDVFGAPLLNFIKEFGSDLLGVAGNLGEFVTKSVSAWKEAGTFKEFLEDIKNGFKQFHDSFQEVTGMDLHIPKLSELVEVFKKLKEHSEPIGNTLQNLYTKFKNFFGIFGDKETTPFQDFGTLLGKIANWISGLGGKIKDAFSQIGGAFNETASLDGVNTIIGSFLAGGGIKLVLSIIKQFKETFGGIGGIIGSFKEALEGIGDAIEDFQNKIVAETLKSIATSVLMLAGALLVLSLIDPERLGVAVVALGSAMTTLVSAMVALDKLMSDTSSGDGGLLGKILPINRKKSIDTTPMIGIAAAVLILAGACKILSTIDANKLGASMATVSWFIGEITACITLLDKVKTKAVKGFTSLATAVLILSVATKIVSSIEAGKLGPSVAAISWFVAEMTACIALLDKVKTKAVTGFTAMSVAVLIISVACKVLSSIDGDSLTNAMFAVSVMIAELSFSLKYLDKVKSGAGAKMIAMAAAILLMSSAVSKLGGMNLGSMIQGLAGITTMLVGLVLAANAFQGSAGGAAAMILMATALNLLIIPIKVLGEMDTVQMFQGLVAMATAMTIIAIGGGALAPVVPVLLSFAGACALMGTALVLGGAGLIAISLGLKWLVKNLTGSVRSLIIGFGLIAASIVAVIPTIAAALAGGVAIFLTVLVGGLGIILTTLFASLRLAIPQFVGLITDVINAIIEALIILLPSLFNLIITALGGLIDMLVVLIPKIVALAEQLILAFIEGILYLVPIVAASAVELVISFIEAIADALYGNTARLTSAITKLITAMVTVGIRVVLGLGSKLLAAVKKFMESGFVQGIKSKASAVAENIKSAAQKGVNTLLSFPSRFAAMGRNLIQGFINGIKEKLSAVGSAVSGVAETAVSKLKGFLGIHSPSRVAGEIGGYFIQGFVNEIGDSLKAVGDSTMAVGRSAVSALTKAIEGSGDILDDEFNSPVITPVLDFTRVRAQVGELRNIFGGSFGIATEIAATRNFSGENNIDDIVDILMEIFHLLRDKDADIDENAFIRWINRRLGRA